MFGGNDRLTAALRRSDTNTKRRSSMNFGGTTDRDPASFKNLTEVDTTGSQKNQLIH